MHFLRGIGDTLLDFIFPSSDRAKRIASTREEPLSFRPHARRCNGRPIAMLASYDDPRVRDAVCALKFERDRQALALLASLLDDFLVEQIAEERLFGGAPICVPIPLGAKRLSERGFNQVEEILKATRSVKTGQLKVAHALSRVRETKMQSALPRAERLENMRGAFAVIPAFASTLSGASILLIDDVATTGATMSEAASILERAGANVHALALAG